ncbi:MAG: hypothetical protein ABWW66_02275, partial [Archaeoglobaceae archaeon]
MVVFVLFHLMSHLFVGRVLFKMFHISVSVVLVSRFMMVHFVSTPFFLMIVIHKTTSVLFQFFLHFSVFLLAYLP